MTMTAADERRLQEIIRTRQCPGIITGTARATAAGSNLCRYDRATDSYFDRARRRRVPAGGAARARDLKAHGEVDLQDFKSAGEFMRYNEEREPGPQPMKESQVREAIAEEKAHPTDLRRTTEAVQELKAANGDPEKILKAVRKAKTARR